MFSIKQKHRLEKLSGYIWYYMVLYYKIRFFFFSAPVELHHKTCPTAAKKTRPADCRLFSHFTYRAGTQMAHLHFVSPLARENIGGLSSQTSIPVSTRNCAHVAQ